MGAAEIISRAGREPAHQLDDLTWRFARPAWRRRWDPPIERVINSPIATSPLGLLTADRAEELQREDPAGAEEIMDAAERALEGRFRFFGYPEVRLERPLCYSRDPFSGRVWPDRFAQRIDYRRSNVGDPKWIWELNHCQHIPILIQAWLLSNDVRFVDCAVRDLTDWIEQQPVGRGIAWANGFEAALRAISFAACYDALRATESVAASAREGVLVSLWQHARWIRREPSTHSSANNHRIGELVGLAIVGLIVPELGAAEVWVRDALRELEIEVRRQILPDGTSAEQAFAYHLFVLDLLLLLAALLVCRSRPVPAALSAALARSADALALQLGDGEPAPTYGDTDDGRAFRYDGTDLRTARGVAASLAAFLGHAGARRVAGQLDPAARWLFGSEGAARFSATAPAPSPGSVLLPDGGVVVLRSGDRRLLFDVGPLGYGSLAAHGHADALQVTLAHDGVDLIVDPGVGSFFAHGEWRDAFRSTGFHPSVTVDGLDQSESRGPFLWGRHAHARLLEVELEEGVAIGRHDGYLRLRDPVSHVRAVVALADGPILIVDRLEARQRHRFVQTWPLHPMLEARLATETVVHATRQGLPRLLLAFAASVPGHAELIRGSDRPLGGWWSPRLESRVPAWHCSWRTEVEGPVTLVALAWPLHDVSWPDPAVSLAASGPDVSIEFDAAGSRRRVAVSFAPPTSVVASSEIQPAGAIR